MTKFAKLYAILAIPALKITVAKNITHIIFVCKQHATTQMQALNAQLITSVIQMTLVCLNRPYVEQPYASKVNLVILSLLNVLLTVRLAYQVCVLVGKPAKQLTHIISVLTLLAQLQVHQEEAQVHRLQMIAQLVTPVC